MSFEAWKAKQRGNPWLLLAAALGFTGSFYGAYKFYYKPWATRRRLAEAERYATFLYEKEKNDLEN